MNPAKEYASCSVPQEPEQETIGDLVEVRRAVRNKRKPGVKEQDSETQIRKLRENQQIYRRNQKTLSQQVQEKDREVFIFIRSFIHLFIHLFIHSSNLFINLSRLFN